MFANLFDKVPARRAGKMEDIAGTILYLCSQAGVSIHCDWLPARTNMSCRHMSMAVVSAWTAGGCLLPMDKSDPTECRALSRNMRDELSKVEDREHTP